MSERRQWPHCFEMENDWLACLNDQPIGLGQAVYGVVAVEGVDVISNALSPDLQWHRCLAQVTRRARGHHVADGVVLWQPQNDGAGVLAVHPFRFSPYCFLVVRMPPVTQQHTAVCAMAREFSVKLAALLLGQLHGAGILL